ncbi:hypothetical protein GCK32_021615 [Trichostrongylus colubriformis]|uniref:Uncharacterized protein n=1 Tax=Trichostrongylus colubriformis TaxID=6319 RepID=A0AAN8ILX3_TRICO
MSGINLARRWSRVKAKSSRATVRKLTRMAIRITTQ